MRGGARNKLAAPMRALRGTETRKHHRHEPKIKAGTPDPPRHLTPDEQELWEYYAPLLAEARILTKHDRDALVNFCEARAQVVELKRQQADAAYRRVLVSTMIDGAGNERVRVETNPLDVQRRAWTDKARLCAAELGLSPMSRARVTAVGAEEPDAEQAQFDRLLKRIK